jgi:hypothetical protein
MYISRRSLLETPLSSLALDSCQYDIFLLNQIVFVTLRCYVIVLADIRSLVVVPVDFPVPKAT